MAAYKQFDVLMVNAIFDGMNLVAKEAVVVNQRHGVLALSENTGAHHELGAFAVTLHPFDLQQQADALYEALTMPEAERRDRREASTRVVRQNDVAKWLSRPSWPTSAAVGGAGFALAPFAAEPARSVVIVDFDGTLAPIVSDPPAASPLPGVAPLLTRLARRVGTVAVVSGRPVAFLRNALPVAGVVLCGQYGVERFDGDTVSTLPGAQRWIDAVRAAADDADAALGGLFVERKGALAVALHWRRRPDLEPAAQELGRRLASTHGLRLEPGRQALELRPPLDVDKGTATAALADGASAALVIGDDRGDLAAFAAAGRLVEQGRLGHALRVAVRSPEAPAGLLAQADLLVDEPDEVLRLLEELADMLEPD